MDQTSENKLPEGNAIIYCEGTYNTPNGKTAHGLVRFTERYRILCVVDSTCAGKDAGLLLEGKRKNIPILGKIKDALKDYGTGKLSATHLVIGLTPDGGRLPDHGREAVKAALAFGLNVDCGLHDFLSEDMELRKLADDNGVQIRDVRKPPPRNELHFFSGNIDQVQSFKVAVLGTDSAVGKRTTAWSIVHGFRDKRMTAELIGTGQTAWMQGVKYSLMLDSLVNDFVSGEIEHAVWTAWEEERPDVIVVEGQGSLLNPAYPGGYEILAVVRPDIIVLQHSPARKEYDGFPGYAIHPLYQQIKAIELISGKPVAAVTISHEGMEADNMPATCNSIREETGLPAFDVLAGGMDGLMETLFRHFPK